MMVVPSGQPASASSVTAPASKCRLTPLTEPGVLVSRSTRLTEAMAARASPRKPMVPMAARSSALCSLEVAWRRKAVRASSALMPEPLSVTRRKVMAAVPNLNGHLGCPGVHGVFQQLLGGGGRALHYLTCGNEIGDMWGKLNDFGHSTPQRNIMR